MTRIVLAGLKAHVRRLIATALAVVLGVAFMAGTLIFGDTARAGFFDTFARLAKNLDAVVRPEAAEALTQEQVARVAGLSDVDAMDIRMVGSLALLDRKGRPVVNFNRVGLAVSAEGDARVRAFDIRGGIPTAPDEALLDVETAQHQRFSVGDSVTVLDRQGGQHRLKLVGLIDFGVSRAYSGSSVVGLTRARLTELTGADGVDELGLKARPGVSPESLVAQVKAALGAGVKVQTGQQRRVDLANEATSVAEQFTFILLIFGVISLVVAVFVIYNTFAILLAQRIRETALLRCVGATKRQVFGAVVLESLIVGAVGGALGVLGGIGVAFGLERLLNGVLNAGVPAHATVVEPEPVVLGMTVGVVVTVLAALLPALRATRTSPLAALRDQPTARVASRARKVVRGVIAGLILGAGGLITLAGWRHSDLQTGTFVIVGGGVLAFLGVLVLAPLFIGPLTGAVGLPIRRIGGTPAQVAIANARRNPGRTAVTSATLMIGVGLMALFSVLTASMSTTAERQLVGHYPVDYVISGIRYDDGGQAGIPKSYVEGLRARSEFAAIAEARAVPAKVGETYLNAGAIDPAALGGLLKPEISAGALSDLKPGTAMVVSGRPWGRNVHLGDTVVLTLGEKRTSLRIVGVTSFSLPGSEPVELLLPWEGLVAAAGAGEDTTVLAKAASGVTPLASRDALDSVGEAYPVVRVSSVADLSSELGKQVKSLLALFAGLMGTAVLIALFGIANTLSLSVVERTRESATLRALGLSRGQLRGTLLIEALLMGVVGALIGVGYGLLYGRLVVLKAFDAIGPTIVIPWSWLAGLIALAAAASVLAAVLPARRAAGVSIVSAMGDV